MTPDTITKDAKSHMDKALEYLKKELKGLRTGRASTALVEYIKVDYYGSPTDLKALAAISIPESSQILIQPFDPQSVGDIKRAIEQSELGLTLMADGKAIRLNVPALSKDRRAQLVTQAKKMGEEAKGAIRNTRRDAKKHSDALEKDKTANYSEDVIRAVHDQVQDLLKKHEKLIDEAIDAKSREISEV